jgi:hypothetical protein
MQVQAETRLVGNRVDWLTLAARVDVAPECVEALRARSAPLKGRDRAAFECAGVFEAELEAQRAPDTWKLANGELARLVVCTDQVACSGWTVELTWRPMTLAAHTFDEILGRSRTLFESFGFVNEWRARRVDLSADFIGFPLHADDAESFVGFSTRSRGQAGRFQPEDKDAEDFEKPTRRTYYQNRKVTGFTVCAGAPLMARVYDKIAQLEATGKLERLAAESARWKVHGWNGEDVTRVEFQARSEVLQQFNARDPDTLAQRLDPMWQYCARKWLRLHVPGVSRLARAELDPRWKAVQEVEFRHESHCAVRVRDPGGASEAQVIGCARSNLAGRGDLPKYVEPLEFQSEGEAQAFVEHELRTLLGLVAWNVIDDTRKRLVQTHGTTERSWSRVANDLLREHNAVAARFAMGPPGPALFPTWLARLRALPKTSDEAHDQAERAAIASEPRASMHMDWDPSVYFQDS